MVTGKGKMTTTAYDIGDARSLAAQFKDALGTNADPSSVIFTMREPDGTTTQYVYGTDTKIYKDGIGLYRVDWTFIKYGRHHARFAGTGAVTTAVECEYWIRASNV